MLMRFDPFAELDRMVRSPMATGMPLDAYRRGDDYVVELDVPGLDPESIEVTVERNVLTITAERRPSYRDGDQLLIAERPRGTVTRQLQVGADVDGDAIAADYHDGVLTVRLPLSERARPHRVPVAAANGQRAIDG